MSRIKVALVGCGRISKNHFQALQNNHNFFELIAVCDIDHEKAQEAAEKYNAVAFFDLTTMLQTAKDIDLIILTTPSGLHPAQSILESNYGKHVLTEKPMSCTLSDAKEMIKASKVNDKRLFVVKQNRLNPTVKH